MAVSQAMPVRSAVSQSAGDRRYVSQYKVESDTPWESPGAVKEATGIPAYRSHYQWPPPHFAVPLFEDQWAFASSVEAALIDPNNSRLLWGVTVIHETLSNTNNSRPAEWADDPLSREAEFSGSSVLFERETQLDSRKEPMRTSAGEIFQDIRIDDHRDTISVTTYQATIDLEQRYYAIGSINDATFWGYAANTVKLTRWDWDVQYYGTGNTPYVINQFEFEMDFRNNWKTLAPDWGHWFKDPDGKPKLFKDVEELNNIKGPLLADGTPADPILGPFRNQEFDTAFTYNFSNLPGVPSTLPNPPFLPPTP